MMLNSCLEYVRIKHNAVARGDFAKEFWEVAIRSRVRVSSHLPYAYLQGSNSFPPSEEENCSG
jgi:hypothetical protein